VVGPRAGLDVLKKRKIPEITGNRTLLLQTDSLVAILTERKGQIPDKFLLKMNNMVFTTE
jgi:hypothetical protein